MINYLGSDDGALHYYDTVMDEQTAGSYLVKLQQEIQWQNDTLVVFGKTVTTKRMIAWYGNDSYNYVYSGAPHIALPWIPCLLELKELTQKHTGHVYNSALLNLYNSGQEGMGWHDDNEKSLGQNPNIATLSFGADRRLDFKHKLIDKKVSLNIQHGSLYTMSGPIQTYWKHQIPKQSKILDARISVTFRLFLG